MKILQAATFAALTIISAGVLGTLAIDALEFEMTGACEDCVLLDKWRDFPRTDR